MNGPKASRSVLHRTPRHIQWVPAVLDARRPGGEVDHLRVSSAEVKNECSYTSTTPYVLGRGSYVADRTN